MDNNNIDYKPIIVNAVVATGMDGEIGYKGKLPWDHDDYKDNTLLNQSIELDKRMFYEFIKNSIVVVGYNTYDSVKFLENKEHLNVSVFRDTRETSFKNILRFSKEIDKNIITIVGGKKTYIKYNKFVNGIRLLSQLNFKSYKRCDTFLDVDKFLMGR